MSLGQEPKSLPVLRENEVYEPPSRGQVRRTPKYRNAITVDGCEILRQHEGHIGAARNRDLAEPVEVDGESTSRLTQGYVFRGAAGDTIEAPRVAADFRQDLPAFLPTVGLQERLEHHVH